MRTVHEKRKDHACPQCDAAFGQAGGYRPTRHGRIRHSLTPNISNNVDVNERLLSRSVCVLRMQRCSPQVHPTRTLGMRAISATVLLSKSVTLFQAFLSKICEESSPAASRDVEPMSKCAAAAVDLRASYRSTAFRPVLVTTAAGQPVRLVSNCHFRPRGRHP